MLTFRYLVAAFNLLMGLISLAVAVCSHKEKGVTGIFGVMAIYSIANMTAIMWV